MCVTCFLGIGPIFWLEFGLSLPMPYYFIALPYLSGKGRTIASGRFHPMGVLDVLGRCPYLLPPTGGCGCNCPEPTSSVWGFFFFFLFFFFLERLILLNSSYFHWVSVVFFVSWVFFCLFAFSRATPGAYGGSQARGLIGAIATGLRQNHSNAGSKPRLRLTPQLIATPDC